MADFDKVILNGTTYTIPQGDNSFKLYNYSSGSCFNFNLDNKKLMMGQTTPQKQNHAIWLLIRNRSTNTYEAACFWVQYGINQQRRSEWSSIFSNLSNYGGTVTGELDFTGFDTSNLESCLTIYTCSQSPATPGYTITNGTIDDTVLQLIMDTPSYSGASSEIKTMVTNSGATVNQSAAIQRLYDEKALSELDSEQSSSLTDGYITKTVRHYRYGSDGNPTYQDKTERLLKIDTDSFGYDSYNSGLTFTQPYIDGTLVSQNLTPVFTITDLESTYSYEGQNYFNAIVIDIVPAFAEEFGNGNIHIDYPSGSGYTYGSANINYDSYSGLIISGQLTQDNYKTIDGVFGTKNLLLFPSSVHGPATITVRNDSGLIAGVSFYVVNDDDKLSFTKWQTNVMTNIYGSDAKEEVTSRALNYVNDKIGNKQDTLVSGTNIKTINNQSILGAGNITIEGGGGGGGISGITMNGSAVTVTSGVADLGTVITEHQSLANYYTKTEIDAMIGNISSSLDTINGEVI